MRIHVLADSDTRWKWGAGLATGFCPQGEVHAHMLRGRSTPTARQMAEVGITPASITETTLPEFVTSPEVADADVIVLGTVGGATQAALHGLAHAFRDYPQRPVLVTGYVGVVYEKVTDGLLLRAGADIVLANSPYDTRRFRGIYEPLGIPGGSVVQTALPFLEQRPYDMNRAGAEHPYTVCFAVQPSVPEDRKSRTYLLRRAIQHARLRPGRDVLIKLRSRPGEQTTHIEAYHYQDLAEQMSEPMPPNLHFVYGNMSDTLDRTDLMITVSSTAALESMHRGMPTGILSDLGVREAHGNHYFVGSGCVTSWDDVDQGEAPLAHEAWKRDQGILADDPYGELRSRIDVLLRAPALPPITPYYTRANASGYMPTLLARRGLNPDGSPARGEGATGGSGSARRTSRRVMRSAYQFGVQRVAPKLQRWGDV
ncbi:DUF6716 putative glycosyltransferase [Streptomyces nitrosporeus]|uniref:Uncharacterized protein n=1 Tax=Streptomyces nitrosporeus TaxID=28894 RepID=A0A5J6F624_9ACTN|nr:DUF6716 putative glycosyltransferase [Streptomyces nitrosporeus]QEU71552.1 hypothetical protein CP967_05865 [Streptomyces nitrosporeus]GGZ11309.1 hypothetical protein GCM10010327_47570 [Streptomyces nitrosporeus]